jgi:hypothetical protein
MTNTTGSTAFGDDTLLRPREVAAYLNFSLAWVEQHIGENALTPVLPYSRIGRSIRTRLGDLKAFVESNKAAA